MNTISPAIADAYHLLRQELYVPLDEAECLSQSEKWTDEELASVRNLIPDLTTVIRGMLAEHKGLTGSCDKCGMAWPCDIVQTVHRLLKDPDHEFVRIVLRAEEDR